MNSETNFNPKPNIAILFWATNPMIWNHSPLSFSQTIGKSRGTITTLVQCTTVCCCWLRFHRLLRHCWASITACPNDWFEITRRCRFLWRLRKGVEPKQLWFSAQLFVATGFIVITLISTTLIQFILYQLQSNIQQWHGCNCERKSVCLL